MPRSPQSHIRALTAAVVVFVADACDNGILPTAPTDETAPLPHVITCRADVAAGAVSCESPTADPAPGLSLSSIVGGQGKYVQLASSNVSYASGVFQADVTVQNLIAQPLGTPDGTTVTGIKVFFYSGPTVTSGAGPVSVANADGTGAFTASAQPYFEYGELLPSGSISSPKTWQWSVPPTVGTFEFSVYVSTDIPVVPGVWEATPTPAFGTVDFTVNNGSNTITDFQFNVDNYMCGSVLVIGSAGFANTWPITNRQFSIDHTDSGNRFVLAGTFGARGQTASGTWELTVSGGTCSGTWQGVPNPPRIVFSSDRTGNAELHIMNADGGALMQLTQLGSDFTGGPAWSPAGSRIAFYSAGLSSIDVFLVDPDGSGLSRITGGSARQRSPTWSPDGSKVAYVTNYSSISGSDDLTVVDPDGSGMTTIYGDLILPGSSISWSPDGSLVAFSDLGCLPNPAGCISAKERLFAVPADGSGTLYIVPATDDATANNFDPAYSPDGQKLAFTSDRDGNNEIYVLDLSQGGLTRLTNHNASDSQPAWSSNSMKIAFVSNRDGNDEIYVMDADGTNPVNITNDPAQDSHPSWSR